MGVFFGLDALTVAPGTDRARLVAGGSYHLTNRVDHMGLVVVWASSAGYEHDSGVTNGYLFIIGVSVKCCFRTGAPEAHPALLCLLAQALELAAVGVGEGGGPGET